MQIAPELLRPARPALTVVPRSVPHDLMQHPDGHYRASRAHLLHRARRDPLVPTAQARVLAWLRDHVHRSIPRAWYRLVLGHDLHLSTYARLYVKHFHATEPDPFTGELGWWEDVGLVSEGKVTTGFRDTLVDNLVTDTTAFGDYKFQRVGTGSTAEANTDTGLVTDAGLEATGTQVEASAPVYRSVATITATATQTWSEHQIRNVTGATGGVLMDRSLISPTVAVVASDQCTFTYEISFSAEP